LRSLSTSGVPAGDVPRFVFLVNHVIGEKESRWAEALSIGSAAAASLEVPSKNLLRHLAVAAWLAGDVVHALEWRRRLAASAGCSTSCADLATWMGALASTVETGAIAEVCEEFLPLAREAAASPPSPVDDLIAATMNNFVSALVEVEGALAGSVARAIEEGARACRTVWLRAGTWVNHERADYLCALAFARLGRAEEAREAALRGLQIIEAGGPQDVDEAFLLLELAWASRALGRVEESDAALVRAHAIAGKWSDPGLLDWFRTQRARRELPVFGASALAS
jgi:hypothetical protein